MLKYAQEFVHVSGAVYHPGAIEIPLGGSIDLDSAIALAGGLTAFAKLEAIELVSANGVSETWTWAKIRGAKEKRLLDAGDQIIVSKSTLAKTSVHVEGQVKKPGMVAIPKNGKLNLAAALVLAVGPGPNADLSRIELIPADGEPLSRFHYDAILKGRAGKIPLGPGDRVRVHKSPFVGLGITLKGAVLREGFQPFPLDGRFDLMNAIAMAGGFNRDANTRKVELIRDGKIFKPNTMELRRKGIQMMLQPGDIIKVPRYPPLLPHGFRPTRVSATFPPKEISSQ